MKQYVTTDQLNELSDKGKEKLREWWKPQIGDLCTHLEKEDNESLSIVLEVSEDKRYKDKVFIHDLPDGDFQWFNNTDYNPLLSIGQMIEFLVESANPKTIVKRSELHGGYWDVNAITKNVAKLTLGEMEKALAHIEKPELCDALWEGTKEILEK